MSELNGRRLHELKGRGVSQKTSRVPSKSNDIADLLSRGALSDALRFAKEAGLPIIKLEASARWRDLSKVPVTWDVE